jgi:chromosome segregation ATPase
LGGLFVRISKPARLFLSLRETQTVRLRLRDELGSVRQRIEINRNFLAKFGADNSERAALLGRLQAGLVSLQYDVRMQECQVGRLESELRQLSSDLASAGERQSAVESGCIEEHRQLDAELSAAQHELEALEGERDMIEREIAEMPNRVRIQRAENDIMIAKRRQLAQEIKKKIKQHQDEMLNQQVKSSEVVNLTRMLEHDWAEHARLLEQTKELQSVLLAHQETIARKRSIAEALRAQGQVAGQPGMRYLEQLHSVAMTQNRDMAREMRGLKRELDMVEAEKVQFLRELAAMK